MKKNITLNLSIARSCFLACKGCYNHFNPNADLISNADIINFLKIASTFGIKKVTLCGGDPLSRPDIIDLLKDIKKLGFYIALDTVGTPLLDSANTIFFGQHKIEKINAGILSKYVDLIGIPLDGASNEVIQSFRKGRANIFEEQIRIIELLEKANAKICINTIVHKQNIDDLLNLVPLMKNFKNINKWQFFQFMPIGPLGFRNRELFWIEEDQFNSFKISMQEAAKKNMLIKQLEFKNVSSRKGSYVLIDSTGDAWMPQYTAKMDLEKDKNSTEDKIILGNIRHKDEQESILNIIKKFKNTFVQN